MTNGFWLQLSSSLLLAATLAGGVEHTISFSMDGGDDDCTLLPGVCDDNSHLPSRSAAISASSAQNLTRIQKELQDVYSRVKGQFYCYKTAEGNFLAYDPPLPDTSKVVNKQLPKTIKDLQTDWMHSSFEFGEPCQAMGSKTDCPKGFTVDTAGIGVVNDAGNEYGGGSSSAPPHCGGCQEEVVVCLSSARSVRHECTSVPIQPFSFPVSSSGDSEPLSFPFTNASAPKVGCGMSVYKNPWVLRNRNLMAHNDKKGTGKYFYLVTIQGFPCRSFIKRDAAKILSFIKGFAQGFQGIIDVWRAKPACDGKCMMVSGAVSAWMTYSIPVAVSVLAQLRAWASLKVDGIEGCTGKQAVLKFGSVSVSDDGVPCCPEPHSGGRCNQNYPLPKGWETHLVEDSDMEFATWLADELGNGVGSCDQCDNGAPDPGSGMCPNASFDFDDPKCKAYTFTNYIPKVPAPPPPPPGPTPGPPGPSPVPGPGGGGAVPWIIAGVGGVLLIGIVVFCVIRFRKQQARGLVMSSEARTSLADVTGGA